MIKLLILIFKLCYIQIEYIINLIAFIILTIYNKINYFITYKKISNFTKFNMYIYSNKFNIIHNLLFFILDPCSIYYYILCISTIITLIYKTDKEAISNFMTILLKTLYLILKKHFFFVYYYYYI